MQAVAISKEQTEFKYWMDRALASEKRLEALDFVVLYAKDIVELWPTITIRTLWKMTDKVATLKEALKQAF